MKTRLVLSVACAAALLGTPAWSQTFLQPGAPDPAAIPSWPVTVPAEQILVVTFAEPKVRHSCKVKSLTAQALTCTRSLGREPVAYAPGEVEALINPRDHSHPWLFFGGVLGVGGGILYAATLLYPVTAVGAVFVAIAGGYLCLSSPLAFILGDEADTPDRLLYLAPGHQLSVTLRK